MTKSDPDHDPATDPTYYNRGRANVVLGPLIELGEKHEQLKALLRPGQYARLEEVKGHLMAIGEGVIKTCPDIRTSILECLDSMDEVQLKSDLGKEFAGTFADVLYQCSVSGLTQRVANVEGKWAGWSK